MRKKTQNYFIYLACCLGLVSVTTGCGRPLHATAVQQNTYRIKASSDESYTLAGQITDQLQLETETPDLQSITRPADAPSAAKLNSNLSQKISSFKIETDSISTLRFHSEVEIKGAVKTDATRTLLFDLQRKSEKETELVAQDSMKDYLLRMRCEDVMCSRGWVLLYQNSSKEYAELRFERKIEYITDNTDQNSEEFKQIQNDLLRDAIEYKLPVVRYSTEVTNGTSASRLVIQEPDVDEVDEEFKEDDGSEVGKAGENIPELPTMDIKPEPKQKPRVIELETTPSSTSPAAPLSGEKEPEKQTIPLKPAQAKSEPKKSTSDDSISAKSTSALPAKVEPILKSTPATYRLTDNLSEAYGIKLPPRLLDNKQSVIKDPFAINTSFDIIPVADQQPLEPAYRMTVIAQAFVQQKIKVYRNACNIFVRSIMNLSGYTSGSVYNANQFHATFSVPTNNLNRWLQAQYTAGGTTQTKLNREALQKYFANLPENHAVVAQVRRNGRHGHVSLMAREGNQIVVYDASLNDHGPRRTITNPNQLLNSSRQNNYLFSIPGLVDKKSTVIQL